MTGAISITEGVAYTLEVRSEDYNMGAIEPYLLYLSMSQIDPAQVILPGTTMTGAVTVTATTPTTPVTTKTETTEVTPTGKVTILTSGQVGPLGGDLFVTSGEAGLDGARLAVPADALAELTTIDIGVTPDAPSGAPFGLQPAGTYWVLTQRANLYAAGHHYIACAAGRRQRNHVYRPLTGHEWVGPGRHSEEGRNSIAAPTTCCSRPLASSVAAWRIMRR